MPIKIVVSVLLLLSILTACGGSSDSRLEAVTPTEDDVSITAQAVTDIPLPLVGTPQDMAIQPAPNQQRPPQPLPPQQLPPQQQPPQEPPIPPQQQPPEENDLDAQLRLRIAELGLTGDPSQGRNLPSINDPIPQLGMRLFFSKSLGGEFDSACVTCHHPRLGGGDQLSLSIGVEAIEPDLLGPGRHHIDEVPLVPRNAPTTFNAGLWDVSLFHDSRVTALQAIEGTNGELSEISTPDSGFGIADENAGTNLAAAQARFPVTSIEEMRTSRFLPGADNDTLRTHLAQRIGGYGDAGSELSANEWLTQFQLAFDSNATAEELVTYDNIAFALGEYERSQVFVNNAWRDYVEGDNNAISDNAKRGALLFFRNINQGGAGCFRCHSGDNFTDEQHHIIAFPQIGPGKGHGNEDDFGLEGITGNPNDRYRFRTASLLNIALSSPYNHAGSYESLEQVLAHYSNNRRAIENYFTNGGWCQLTQFQDIADCTDLYPFAEANTLAAIDAQANQRDQQGRRQPPVNSGINRQQQQNIIAFLNTLTDSCLTDTDCIASWIPPRDEGPDGQQLNAYDQFGIPF